jgi:hypothetical protein
MRRHKDIADGQHGAVAIAAYVGQLGPAVQSLREGRGGALHIARRHQRDKHAVDIGGVERIGRIRCPSAEHLAEGQGDPGILIGAGGKVPQPHNQLCGWPPASRPSMVSVGPLTASSGRIPPERQRKDSVVRA